MNNSKMGSQINKANWNNAQSQAMKNVATAMPNQHITPTDLPMGTNDMIQGMNDKIDQMMQIMQEMMLKIDSVAGGGM